MGFDMTKASIKEKICDMLIDVGFALAKFIPIALIALLPFFLYPAKWVKQCPKDWKWLLLQLCLLS